MTRLRRAILLLTLLAAVAALVGIGLRAGRLHALRGRIEAAAREAAAAGLSLSVTATEGGGGFAGGQVLAHEARLAWPGVLSLAGSDLTLATPLFAPGTGRLAIGEVGGTVTADAGFAPLVLSAHGVTLRWNRRNVVVDAAGLTLRPAAGATATTGPVVRGPVVRGPARLVLACTVDDAAPEAASLQVSLGGARTDGRPDFRLDARLSADPLRAGHLSLRVSAGTPGRREATADGVMSADAAGLSGDLTLGAGWSGTIRAAETAGMLTDGEATAALALLALLGASGDAVVAPATVGGDGVSFDGFRILPLPRDPAARLPCGLSGDVPVARG